MNKKFWTALLILAYLLFGSAVFSADDTDGHTNPDSSATAKTVLVPLAEGFEDTEAIPMISILRRAGATVTVASLGDTMVASAQQVTVHADTKLSDCADKTYDLIVLHGGMPAAVNLRDSELLKEMLIEQNRQGRHYGAICASSVVVLHAHGLLEGKQATCYPSMAEQLSDPSAAKQRVVVDKNCITSQGPGTTMEFAITLVEVLFGEGKAEQLRKGYLIR